MQILRDLPAQCNVNARIRARATYHDLLSAIPDRKGGLGKKESKRK